MSATWEGRLKPNQVANLCQVSYRQLDYWLRTGLIPEPATPANGAGSARGFAFEDVVRVSLVSRLRAAGVGLAAIRRALDALERAWTHQDPRRLGRLVAIDGQVCLEADSAALWDILARQGAARRIVVVDVGELARETHEQMEGLDQSAA